MLNKFIGLILILKLLIAVSALKLDDPPEPEICNTPDCVVAAHSLIQNMDLTADPCEDFYQYACGNFEKRVRIPDDKSAHTQFNIIDDELDYQLRDILSSNETSGESSVFQYAKDHYQACMNLDKLEDVGVQPALDLLKKFGGWPVLDDKWDESNFDWEKTAYTLRENGYSPDIFFDFSVGQDLVNSTWRTIYLDQAGLGLSREYLIKGVENERVQHYFEYMKTVAELFGADPKKAQEELMDLLHLEIKLANMSMSKEERRDITKLYNPTTLAEMNQNYPFLDWTKYINEILSKEVTDKVGKVESDERVILIAPTYYKELAEVLHNEPKRNLANLMMWKAAKGSISYLNKAARDTIEDYVKKLSGKKIDTPRWKTCTATAAGSFSAAVGKLYVQKHFQEDAKESMMEMVSDIKDEFRHILNEISWMDENTKAKAHIKLDLMKDYIGYPKEIFNNTALEEVYEGLEITDNTFFLNAINMSKWSTNKSFKKLREKVDKTDWKRHANPAIVNAFYNSIENSMQFPAGILQDIFFDKSRPNYMNYAAIGCVVGHELSHGFDDQGRRFDAEGNLNNWWDDETSAKYVEKTKCIIYQYGNYTEPSVNLPLNGINTQGENIADNAGFKQAYRAYDRWVTKHGQEKILPGLNLNQKQLFWLSAANTWCSKYRPKALESLITLDTHSPGRYRVLGAYSNIPEFASDFQCKIGSKYNPLNKCTVW